jgi:hypothetical protein
MADANESRRKPLIIQAVNPVDGKTCEVQISYQRLQAVAARSKGQLMEAAHTVPFILQGPTAVFEGLRREEDEDRWGCGWRCYCGIPPCSYRADGSESRTYPRQVYLVFVNDQGVAYNWRWEKADQADSRLPMHHETRFKRRLL